MNISRIGIGISGWKRTQNTWKTSIRIIFSPQSSSASWGTYFCVLYSLIWHLTLKVPCIFSTMEKRNFWVILNDSFQHIRLPSALKKLDPSSILPSMWTSCHVYRFLRALPITIFLTFCFISKRSINFCKLFPLGRRESWDTQIGHRILECLDSRGWEEASPHVGEPRKMRWLLRCVSRPGGAEVPHFLTHSLWLLRWGSLWDHHEQPRWRQAWSKQSLAGPT